MNNFYREIAGSLARTIIGAAAGAGLLAEGDIAQYSSALALLMVGVWSAYQKYTTRQKLVTMGAAPRPMSEAMAEAQIARGQAASVTTPSAHVPMIAEKV